MGQLPLKGKPQTVDKLQIVVCRGVNEYITITSNNNMVNNVVLNCRGGFHIRPLNCILNKGGYRIRPYE
jgi:hypothetical protein